MPKQPKTVGDLVDILQRYNRDLPLQIELVKNDGKDSVYGEIDDVYKGEDILFDEDTMFIRFED